MLEIAMLNERNQMWKPAWIRFQGHGDSAQVDSFHRFVGAQYATGDQCRNDSKKNEETEPKQKQHPAVFVTDDGSKVWCCKEQYCMGIWNIKSMNQGKLEVVKQEMARVNINTFRNQRTKMDWNGWF